MDTALDANGNMSCREENAQTWKLTYNNENRLSKLEKIGGSCASQGSMTESWDFVEYIFSLIE